MANISLVIFGITGNLAQKKLIPAIFELYKDGFLQNFTITGVGRRNFVRQEFEKHISEFLNITTTDQKLFKKFLANFKYFRGEFSNPRLYLELKNSLKKIRNRIFYLATYPEHYETILQNLKPLTDDQDWARLIIEKPIGRDLASAEKLNTLLGKYFSEEEIYRVDHYLGKETIQNILTFRFSNVILDQLLTRDYVDHIQIISSEEIGIGSRGGYFDSVGALKDVGQNHILQMLSLTIMNLPKNFSQEEIVKSKLEALLGLEPIPTSLVFGQYEGYTNEENVAKDSVTETFFALKTRLNKGRLKGVPIYIRSGKKLKTAVTEISIVFKKLSHEAGLLFGFEEPNVLTYRIQPNEGIVFEIYVKKPGHKMEVEPEMMQFCYKNGSLPNPYAKLILNAINGDRTFFNTAAEVHAQWKFIDKLLTRRPKTEIYLQGTWGPESSNSLIQDDRRRWLEPSPEICKIR